MENVCGWMLSALYGQVARRSNFLYGRFAISSAAPEGADWGRSKNKVLSSLDVGHVVHSNRS